MAINMKVPQGFEALAELGLYDCGLTEKQIKFLDRGTWFTRAGKSSTWTVNPDTGLVDIDGDFIEIGRFLYEYEKLTDFKGIRFGRVSGDFNCSSNILTSLVGAPKWVGGSFCCSYNRLTSLVGAPEYIGNEFDCLYNNRLTSLEGLPTVIRGEIKVPKRLKDKAS